MRGADTLELRFFSARCGALFITFLALSSPACAGAREDALQAIGKCAGLGDAAARLACYDAAAPRVRAALATPLPPGTPDAKDKSSWFGFDFDSLFGTTPQKQTTPAQFGSERLPAPAAAPGAAPAVAEPLESIESALTDYAYTPTGRFIIFLANGQVWRQIEGDTDRAYFKRNAADNKVIISRGMLGSYDLKIVGGRGGYKVHRVK